jgi:hypothetical protein
VIGSDKNAPVLLQAVQQMVPRMGVSAAGVGISVMLQLGS